MWQVPIKNHLISLMIPYKVWSVLWWTFSIYTSFFCLRSNNLFSLCKYRCPKVSHDHEIKTINVQVGLISLVSYVQRLSLGEMPEATRVTMGFCKWIFHIPWIQQRRQHLQRSYWLWNGWSATSMCQTSSLIKAKLHFVPCLSVYFNSYQTEVFLQKGIKNCNVGEADKYPMYNSRKLLVQNLALQS